MILSVLGISHKTAPLDVREKLSLNAELHSDLLDQLRQSLPCSDYLVLSTCNRTELYFVSEQNLQKESAQFLQEYFKVKELQALSYFKTQDAAINHLFRVVSGLDSLVLGENEILKQVKDAYLKWHKAGATGKVLNVFFQRALYVGKMVRTHTSINQGSLSVSSLAVTLAERIFGSLSSSSVLLFGAGTMAELAARQLIEKKTRAIWVANRTLENAQHLARQFHGQALTLDQGLTHLLEADVVITSLSVSQPFIRKAFLEDLIERRKNRSLFIVDIGLPRNVEPGSHELDNVYLYNIDDLERLVQENIKTRQSAINIAQRLVDDKTAEFYDWFCSLQTDKEKSLKHSLR